MEDRIKLVELGQYPTIRDALGLQFYIVLKEDNNLEHKRDKWSSQNKNIEEEDPKGKTKCFVSSRNCEGIRIDGTRVAGGIGILWSPSRITLS